MFQGTGSLVSILLAVWIRVRLATAISSRPHLPTPSKLVILYGIVPLVQHDTRMIQQAIGENLPYNFLRDSVTSQSSDKQANGS